MISKHRYVRSLDESFRDTLAPGALIVALTYLAIAPVHLFFGEAGRLVLGPLELVSSAFLFGLYAYCRKRDFEARAAGVLGAAIVAPILVINTVYYRVYPEPDYTFGLYAVVVGTGMIPFGGRWYAAIVVASLAVFASAVLFSTAAASGWVEPAVVMAAMVALGAAVHVWRVRHAMRMDLLREEAERSQTARERFERRYRDMTEHANDMITELDARGRILYANPAHELILGYRPEDLVGLCVRELVVADDEAARGLQPSAVDRRQVVVRHAHGGTRTLECSLRAFELDSGEQRLIATTRDVTDRVASERALEQGRVELETLIQHRTAELRASIQELRRADRLASMGTVTAGIAHQINNPIGSILMSAELALLSEGAEDEREVWRETLENCRDQARRCGQIVSSMLQFARKEPTERSYQDLAELVRRVCDQTESYARSRLAVIDTSGIEGPLPVFVIAIEIEQALLNIVRNATESSTGAVRVGVSTGRDGDFATVTISDDGDGMEARDAQHAFDPFFTTRLDQGGSGLGLSVAHGVVVDHDGLLSIDSAKGLGTTFVVRLPLALADRTRSGERPAGARAGNVSLDANRREIERVLDDASEPKHATPIRQPGRDRREDRR